MFLVLEGIEGSGKSTQARLLRDWLDELGVPCLLTREPGGTPSGEAIRRILLEGGEVPAEAELLLMLAARSLLVQQVVRPALARGQVVIADRFALSSMAYQGYGRGLGAERVRELNAFATGGLAPDLVILLDVPFAEGNRRRRAEGRSDDRIERAGEGFHERVAQAYALLAGSERGIERVEATGSPEQVQAAIRSLLQSRFPETFTRNPG
jgi:dTMP kinase